MATANSNLNIYMTNDADFRSIIDFIHNCFIAGGLVQTSDSGQLDRATVTKPNAIHTSAGKLIYRFDDALQSSKPVFFCLEPATNGTANVFSYFLTVGTGSNGAGNITGVLLPRFQAGRMNGSGGNGFADNGILRSCWASAGGANRACFFIGNNSADKLSNSSGSPRTYFGIERSLDNDNNPTNEGILLIYGSLNPVFNSTSVDGAFSQYIPFAGTLPPATPQPFLTPTEQTTGTISTDVSVFPPIFWDLGKIVNPSTNFYSVFANDFVEENTFPVNIGGSVQTMVRLTKHSNASLKNSDSSAAVNQKFAFMMRYD